MDIRLPHLPKAARVAQAYLKTQGITLDDDQAQELSARLHGYADKETMKADTLFVKPLVLRADSSTEYTLLTGGYSGAFVTVENVHVAIARSPEGVRVDVAPAPGSGFEELGSISVSFEEVAKILQEHEDDGGFVDTNPFLNP